LTAEVEGVLLAAGESRRMGYPKPLLKIADRTFLEHTCAAMLTAVESLIVVLGARADEVRRAIPDEPRIRAVENPNFARGQLSSLQVALSAASCEAAAILVHLVDHPTVSATTFQRVVDEYMRTRQPIVIARYRGRRGHPVLFARALFEELKAVPEDEGARVVVNADPARVHYVELDDPGVLRDLDTPQDLLDLGLALPPGRE
jgi:molybdenum cofactor cytidylyltransferase